MIISNPWKPVAIKNIDLYMESTMVNDDSVY